MFFQSTFLLLYLSPPEHAAYKSRGDRLAPLGMSQAGIRYKGSTPDTPRLCSETTSQGDIYMKGTYPSHPSLKQGKRRLYAHSKDRKRLLELLFHGIRLQVLFGLRPTGGLNPPLVSIYITAFYLCKDKKAKGQMCVCVLEGATQNTPENIFLLPPQGAAPLRFLHLPLLTQGQFNLCFTQ